MEAYENESVPMTQVGDAEMLRFLIKQKGVSQNETALASKIAGSAISEVLSGRRKLNRVQIGKLAKFFHVEPSAFLLLD